MTKRPSTNGETPFRRPKLELLLLITFLLLSTAAQAQTVSITGGSRLLTIDTAIAGSEPMEATDNASTVDWNASALGVTSKITVGTTASGQSFSLFVTLDVNSGSGTEQAERQLIDGMLDMDILRDIPVGDPIGNGTLTYRAQATAGQGNSDDVGEDIHTVTYTILSQ